MENLPEMPKIAQIHLTERTDSRPDQRLFDGWIEGFGRNVLPGGYEPHLLTSSKAIDWCCACERAAFEHGIQVERIYHNF